MRGLFVTSIVQHSALHAAMRGGAVNLVAEPLPACLRQPVGAVLHALDPVAC